MRATFFDNDNARLVGSFWDVPVYDGTILGFWEPTAPLDTKTVLFEKDGGTIIRCRPTDTLIHPKD